MTSSLHEEDELLKEILDHDDVSRVVVIASESPMTRLAVQGDRELGAPPALREYGVFSALGEVFHYFKVSPKFRLETDELRTGL